MDLQFDDVTYTNISVQRKFRVNPINVVKSRGRLYRLLITSVLLIISIALIIACFSVSSSIGVYQQQYLELSIAIDNIILEKQGITQTAESMKKSNKQLQAEISKIDNDAKSTENKVSEIQKENEDLQEELSKLLKESESIDKKTERLKQQINYYNNEIKRLGIENKSN